VALVARAKRDLLLRAHRFRLRREDLEDCYSQATLELVVHVRRGGTFISAQHLGNIVEQRFLSRVYDRRRAMLGRSPMQAALHTALPLVGSHKSGIDIPDARTEPERLVIAREELKRVQAIACSLSYEHRLYLACQIGLQMGCAEFCHLNGWTHEKYRKVGQRARARLRELMEQEGGVPSVECSADKKSGTSL
jgi:hypothetical protein